MKQLGTALFFGIICISQLHGLALSDAKIQIANLEAKYQPKLTKLTDPGYESARADYFKQLADIYFGLARDRKNYDTNELETSLELAAIDLQIGQYPPQVAPSVKMFIGSWASPRHDYQYSPDGTWTMLPATPGTTGGKWTIKGFELTATYNSDAVKPMIITIWLLTPDMLMLVERANKDKGPYFLSRITPNDPEYHWGYRN